MPPMTYDRRAGASYDSWRFIKGSERLVAGDPQGHVEDPVRRPERAGGEKPPPAQCRADPCAGGRSAGSRGGDSVAAVWGTAKRPAAAELSSPEPPEPFVQQY